jgi:glycine/D-amino acid oxidase-like deaminating enzyme
LQVAVVGAGLAGLGVSYFLLKRGFKVTLFDKEGVGRGASKIDIGLCHPYVGRSGKPSKFAREALALTSNLIAEVEEKLKITLADRSGILRIDWKPFELYDDVKEVENGFLITSGITVYLKKYVNALYKAMDSIKFEKRNVTNESELEGFDRVIFCSGHGINEVAENLPLNYVKGQVLFTDANYPIITTVMKAHGHLSPLPEGGFQLGASYEHHFESVEPDLNSAFNHMKAKLDAFFSPEEQAKFTSCQAGVRVTNQEGYLPFVKQISEKSFIFSGLGSRGLLYHAYYGRHLANMIT